MRKLSIFIGLAVLIAIPALLSAQQKTTVAIDSQAGITIPDDFLGLSFESAAILPHSNGQYSYFRPDNRELVQLFKTLGIKNLRIGGNTADRPSVKVPSQADIDSLYAFARAAGTRVIYSVRLRESTPDKVIGTSKFVMDRYGAETHCLTVGNEPNVYKKEYPVYRDDLKRYITSISEIAPAARFCGPATTPGAGGWAANFAADFAQSGKIVEVTQHSYPGGNARKVADPAAGRAQLLSPEFVQEYEKLYQAFVPAVQKSGLGYRIEETNSFFNGGAKDVSNTFASALWGLDYLYWWAEHEARGINFHTGDNVAAGEEQTPCWYATFWSTPAGYEVHPLGYAIKAFDLGRHGRLLRTRVSSASGNVSAYSVLGTDGTTYVTLINKDSERSTSVIVDAGKAVPQSASFVSLSAPHSDIAATSGVTLGGGSISADGNWNGKWQPLKIKAKQLEVPLPPASAVVIRVRLQ